MSVKGKEMKTGPTEKPLMAAIEDAAKETAQARSELVDRVGSLELIVKRAKHRRLKGIKAAAAALTQNVDELRGLVERGRHLFKRPKTRTLHGVRLGWAKQKGRLVIDDEDDLVARIEELFPDRADELLKRTAKPVKAALAKLSGKDLQRLGVRIEADTESPMIKFANSEIDKLVESLLDEGGTPS